MAVLQMGIEAYQQGCQGDVNKAIHNMMTVGNTIVLKEIILAHRLPKPAATVF
ncbi:hypothetical protein FRB96_006567 [Tulasnella sp. 330]|nr:hypothetical protein FRB96_006567 [Tulasnella sp. 330]